MAEVLSSATKYLRFREITLDNTVFRLFTEGSMFLCLTGALLCAATQYFGAPITCSFDGQVPGALGEKYCWIHGSNWIKKEYQEAFNCRVSHPDDEDRDTSYYQWVIFFLLLQAALFAFPYKLWHFAERGVLKQFVTAEATSPFVLSDENQFNQLIDSYVIQFRSILHHNSRYFITFVVCELLNVIIVYVNFFLTDVFLNHQFKSYGFKVYDYYMSELRDINPMCEVFPTAVSCNFKIVAESGSQNERNGLCILSQNIVNEKVFLVLFFWYIFLFIVSGIYLVNRLIVITIPSFRTYAILNNMRGKRDKFALNRVLAECYIGDWFVLNQIAKNVNPYFFRNFLDVLQDEIRKPVKSSRKRREPENGGFNTDKDPLMCDNVDNVELRKISPKEENNA